MAEKSVFISKPYYPFFEEIRVQMDWFGGFALSQKRKCETGLHKNFLNCYPDHRILEVSSSSLNELGCLLSAMNLKKNTAHGMTTVESAFQSSRVYMDMDRQIGSFPEYLFLPGRECKKLVKAMSEGLHSYRYEYEGYTFFAPDFHISLFYDFLYLNALLEKENQVITKELLEGNYSAFTDLATTSLNSQARSCAIFMGLAEVGLTDEIKDVDRYLILFRTAPDGKALGAISYENVQLFVKGKAHLLSPVVPNTFPRTDVDRYYKAHYSHLSNKRE